MMLSNIMRKAAKEHRRASTGDITKEEFQQIKEDLENS